MIRFSWLAFSIGCASWLSGAPTAEAQQRPNVVYILADDLGKGDVRSYTENSPVETTQIDRLATEGMLFSNAHAPSAVCSPTRYGVLTGRYAWRTRMHEGVVAPHAPALIDLERSTVADMFREHGYATAAIGKWHLGMEWQTTDGETPQRDGSNVDYSLPFANGPIAQGFDSYYGDDIINWPPLTFMRDDRTVGIPSERDGRALRTPGYDQVEVLPAITAEAVEYLEEQADAEEPFFLYFALTAPHSPIVPPDFIPEEIGTKYDRFIATVDWSVGEILDALQEHGLADNTLVIFTSDNGVSTRFSTSDNISPGFVDGVPLRGGKADIWEGGHHMPFLVRWPGQIEPSSHCSQYVELNDFYATMADMLDATIGPNTAEDSYSLLPLLQGAEVEGPLREAGVNHSAHGTHAIRLTDEQGIHWKLIFNSGSGGWSAPTGARLDPLDPVTDYTTLQLYNMTEDPGEQNNLLAEGGDDASRAVADQLHTLLQRYINEGRSTPAP